MKIWIDLTDLSGWTTGLAGVQRVVYNVTREFADSERPVHYFSFNPGNHQFYEVEFGPVRDAIENAQTAAAAPAAAAPGGVKHLLKRVPKAIIRRVPLSVKQKVPTQLKRDLRAGYHKGMHVLKRVVAAVPRPTRRAPAQTSSSPVAEFGPDDIVLILGGPWDRPALVPALGVLKQQAGFKVYAVAYDLIPTFLPHLYGPGLFEPYTKTLFELCQTVDGFMAISASTKRDVAKFCHELNMPVPPTEVIRLGDEIINTEVAQSTTSPDPRIKPGEYMLTVGRVELRKNHALLYATYREAALQGVDLPNLVIAGHPGWLVGDVMYQMQNDPVVKDKIIVKHGLSDEHLRWLYQNSLFTVYPSVYEGWGLPIAESLAYGKLCLASHTSSMTEIAGDLLDYYSPYNAGECLAVIKKYLDPKVLAAKEKQIKQHYKPYKWHHTFKQVDAFISK